MAGKETVNPGIRVRSNEPCQRDVGRSRTPRRYPHFPRDGSSSQAVRPFRRPSSSKRSGWGRPSSPGVTRTGEYASPRPTARTWAPIWGQTQEAGYALAGSSVPSTAMSSTQPASASPRPMPTPPQDREVASLRNTGSFRPDLRLVGDRGTGTTVELALGPIGARRLEQARDQDPSLCRHTPAVFPVVGNVSFPGGSRIPPHAPAHRIRRQKLGLVEKGVNWSSCVQQDLSWVCR